ncbi:hypothetical protein ACFQ0D_26725, partial [Micromonospora zhanjiangensis]
LDRELADHRQALADVGRELDSLLEIGRALVATVARWWDEDGFDDLLRRALAAVRAAIRVFEQLQAAQDTLRRGLRDVTGKARAGAFGASAGSPFDTVRLAAAGISGSGAEDNGILSTAQLRRAGDLLDALPPAERQRFDELLARAGSSVERAYLMKALAAGHGVEEIDSFADRIRGRSEYWLRTQLSLVDPGARGPVTHGGTAVRQVDGTTCGSTSILIARAMNDPIYALSLTGTGEDGEVPTFADRLRAEELRIHDATNTTWPQRLGTSPWGVSDELNEHADSFGARYDWRLVDDTSPGSVNPALDDAIGAVDAGHTVPVLIGDSYPAHYVLLVGHEGGNLIFYDPSGNMAVVSEDDFRNGNTSALGYHHVQGVIVPS